MKIITHYEIIHKKGDIYFVISKEDSGCPKCGGELIVKDYRIRKNLTKYGEKRNYRLRRLRCKKCVKIHTELPDFMVPHKRYDAEAIESVIEHRDKDCVMSERTKRRWRNWYKKNQEQMARLMKRGIQSLLKLEYPLKEKTKEAGWLKKAIKLIINSGEKVPT